MWLLPFWQVCKPFSVTQNEPRNIGSQVLSMALLAVSLRYCGHRTGLKMMKYCANYESGWMHLPWSHRIIQFGFTIAQAPRCPSAVLAEKAPAADSFNTGREICDGVAVPNPATRFYFCLFLIFY